MKLFWIASLALAVGLGVHWNSGEATTASDAQEVERGRYLVHQVSMCVECHSPRNARGDKIEDRLLMGARIPFKAPFQSRWAELAPGIHQFMGYTDDEARALLMKGKKRNGEAPRGPMPQFGMTEEDANAVLAYLKSL